MSTISAYLNKSNQKQTIGNAVDQELIVNNQSAKILKFISLFILR